MARQVEAHRGFFHAELLPHAPGRGGQQRGLLRTGTMFVVPAHVKQAGLVGVRQHGRTKVKRQVERGQQAGAVALQRVKGACLDQRFDRALVDAAAVDPGTKVKQAVKGARLTAHGAGTAAFARRHNRLNGLLPGALDGTQAVADDPVGNWLEPVRAAVDIGWLKAQSHAQRVFKQHLELVGVVHFHRHIGAEELGRVMHLEPAGVISQKRVGGGVRLVEAVAGKPLHQVKDLVGFGRVDAVFGRAVTEDLAVFGHLVGVFFAHRPAQHVGAAQRVTAQDLRGLHHLLLVNHDAVGLGQHLGH